MANSYGFVFHPYLTLKKVGQDRSQLAIFASLWLGAWLGIFLFSILMIFIIPGFFPGFSGIRKYGEIVILLGGMVLLAFTLYLGWWVFVWWQKERRMSEN